MKKKASPKKLSQSALVRQLKKIRILILDVDGVLTDGKIFWIQEQGWVRTFHVHDGYGIRLLAKSGIQIALFSGSQGLDIQERARILGIQHVYLGNENKIESLMALRSATKIQASEMAYVGDDLFDLPVLSEVGLAITVPQAVADVKKGVHYVTRANGGAGAVREVADLILHAQGHWKSILSQQLGGDLERVDRNQQS